MHMHLTKPHMRLSRHMRLCRPCIFRHLPTEFQLSSDLGGPTLSHTATCGPHLMEEPLLPTQTAVCGIGPDTSWLCFKSLPAYFAQSNNFPQKPSSRQLDGGGEG